MGREREGPWLRGNPLPAFRIPGRHVGRTWGPGPVPVCGNPEPAAAGLCLRVSQAAPGPLPPPAVLPDDETAPCSFPAAWAAYLGPAQGGGSSGRIAPYQTLQGRLRAGRRGSRKRRGRSQAHRPRGMKRVNAPPAPLAPAGSPVPGPRWPGGQGSRLPAALGAADWEPRGDRTLGCK